MLLSLLCPVMPCSVGQRSVASCTHSGERGEADGGFVERERGVHVLHERIAEQPDVVAEAKVLARERADALTRTRSGLAEVKAAAKDLRKPPFLRTPIPAEATHLSGVISHCFPSSHEKETAGGLSHG